MQVVVLLTTGCAFGASQGEASRLILLGVFHGSHSAAAIDEMRTELNELLEDAVATLEWHNLNEGTAYLNHPGRIITVRFYGECRFPLFPPETHPSGILASVPLVRGKIRSTVQVDCDAVASLIYSHLPRSLQAQAEVQLGRGLARVVAHEIYHSLTGFVEHTDSELFRKGLSARLLLADEVQFEEDEIEHLRRALGAAALGSSSGAQPE